MQEIYFERGCPAALAVAIAAATTVDVANSFASYVSAASTRELIRESNPEIGIIIVDFFLFSRSSESFK